MRSEPRERPAVYPAFALRATRGSSSLEDQTSSFSTHEYTVPLPEAADLAQNRPLWRMMSTYGATQPWVACQKRRRRVVIEDCWLYKPNVCELNTLSALTQRTTIINDSTTPVHSCFYSWCTSNNLEEHFNLSINATYTQTTTVLRFFFQPVPGTSTPTDTTIYLSILSKHREKALINVQIG